MIGDAVGTMLPYAVGAAVSPLLLTVELVILAGGVAPKKRAWLYTAGAGVVAAALIALVALIFRSLDIAPGPASPLERGVEITAALVLAVLALKSFLPAHASTDDKPSKLHDWMQHGRGVTFFALGMVMMATNLSSIVIIVPGIHAVEAQRAGDIPALLAYLLALVLLMVPALLPVGVATAFGSHADAFLHHLNVFVTRHSRTITGLICAAIAAYLAIGALS